MEPLLRGHSDKRSTPLEMPIDHVNLNLLISTPDESPPLLKGHYSDAKGVASQEGFHCVYTLFSSIHVHIHIYCLRVNTTGCFPDFPTCCQC